MVQLLAGLGLERPVTDGRVDGVAGLQKSDQGPRVREGDLARLGELAPRADPADETSDLLDGAWLLGFHRCFLSAPGLTDSIIEDRHSR
ncbi:hypothetical protein [Kitasatospora purpeofusca]|uniref:hypothetical protein n=1 Tax=Kitasatospora purpeofusca TaxID=67352 RepID=UPI00386916B5